MFVNEHSKLRLASAVDSTWVKRCSSLAYIGKTPNQSAPLPIVKSNYSLYATRTEATFALGDAVSYVQSKNFSESDWILFSTDNTFVIMENLRYFLSNQNSSDAVYAGKISKVAIGYARPFHSGMIVFSNTALRLLNRTSIESCNEKDVYEVTKSLCLSSNRFVDITPVDNNGTSLMNILPPKQSIKISGSTSKKILLVSMIWRCQPRSSASSKNAPLQSLSFAKFLRFLKFRCLQKLMLMLEMFLLYTIRFTN